MGGAARFAAKEIVDEGGGTPEGNLNGVKGPLSPTLAPNLLITLRFRKDRPFADGLANWSNRPVAALQHRRYERAVSARKRFSAGGAGCALERDPGIGENVADPLEELER